jgi:hypothetical protein
MEMSMGRRVIMSQRAIAGAIAKMNATDEAPIPEVVERPEAATTSLLMIQVFGQRNIAYLPPHIQRQKLAEKLSPPPPQKNIPSDRRATAATRHQAKPYGRSHRGFAFGAA